MLILIFGRSGSGKTKLANYLTNNFNIKEIVSATTKEPEESDGNYNYVSKQEFKTIRMAESARIEGNLYGVPVQELVKGVDDYAVAVVDWQGVESLQEFDPKIIKVEADFTDLVNNYMDRGMSFDESVKTINDEVMYDLIEADLVVHNDMITPVQELAEEILNSIHFYKGEK